jgi:linearmycin/streptolysin S transport system ATP-binding protein
VLECRGLRKQFGERVAVDDVSFTIADGECYGLLGPNGAGKTTTISMLCGLLQPDHGEVVVGGAPGGSLEAKAATGYVPQELALYPDLSANENLEFFGQLYGLKGKRLAARIADTLALVGLADRGKDHIATFSGGMKRRANIAAGLLHEPHLLILDEPTVGVDPQSRNSILETVGGLGIAVLYTTHYMEEASKLCQRVGVIDDGRLIAEGTPDHLIGEHGGQDRVRLTCRGAGAGAGVGALAEACRLLSGVGAVRVTEEGLELSTDHGAAVLPALIELAVRHAVELSGVEVAAPDLEGVFLALTGKALRD